MRGKSLMLAMGLPGDSDLLTALGGLVIARTQLELYLRYTVKTLASLSVNAALETTSGDRMPELRGRIKQLFKQKKPTAQEKRQLDALLLQGKHLTMKCNVYLHATYANTPSGQALMQSDTYSWGLAPTVSEVNAVRADLLKVGADMNHARLHGFIAQVVRRPPPTVS